MTETDKVRFAEIMTALAENFGATVSKPGLSLRFEALKAYTIDDVQSAATAVLLSRKFAKMPTVAEFLEYLGGGSVEDKAMLEASKALRAIKSHGPYASVVFDDATTQAVIEYGFGGWIKLGNELTTDGEKWFLRDFARIYASYLRQGVTRPGVLPGIIETQNQAHGFLNAMPAPVAIGDKRKALEIASAPAPDQIRSGGPVSAAEAMGRLFAGRLAIEDCPS